MTRTLCLAVPTKPAIPPPSRRRAGGVWQAQFVAALLLPFSRSAIVEAFGGTVLLAW